jgi:hypothetical protein
LPPSSSRPQPLSIILVLQMVFITSSGFAAARHATPQKYYGVALFGSVTGLRRVC